MSRLLLIAFQPSELNACAGFGKAMGLPFDVLLIAPSGTAMPGEKNWFCELNSLPATDGVVNGLKTLAENYTHIAAVSSMLSKDIMPRLAGSIDAGAITDVIEVCNEKTFKRPIVAGSVIAKVEIESAPTVITFRPSNFAVENPDSAKEPEKTDLTMNSAVKIISEAKRQEGRPDLTQAEVVVSGGRPLKDAETFEKVVGGLADKLNGAVGATRAAVDSGIAPNELQVGQTGKIVAPNLYIAAGISGSTQHMAGIKDSKVIVAINTDADAPIFEIADIGLVGDLFEVLPELMNKM